MFQGRHSPLFDGIYWNSAKSDRRARAKSCHDNVVDDPLWVGIEAVRAVSMRRAHPERPEGKVRGLRNLIKSRRLVAAAGEPLRVASRTGELAIADVSAAVAADRLDRA